MPEFNQLTSLDDLAGRTIAGYTWLDDDESERLALVFMRDESQGRVHEFIVLRLESGWDEYSLVVSEEALDVDDAYEVGRTLHDARQMSDAALDVLRGAAERHRRRREADTALRTEKHERAEYERLKAKFEGTREPVA